MKNMASVKLRVCPPSGRYPFNITAAAPGFTNMKTLADGTQKGGDSQIELGLEIAEGEHAGYPAYDNLGTDGGTKYGAASVKRLRQLEVQGLDTDAEIPDDVIAQQLLGRRVWAAVEREQQMSKGEDGKLSPRFEVDEKTGTTMPVFRLKILGYLRQPTGQTAAAPHAPAPQGYAPPAPPQYAPPQPPPGYAAAPQYAPPAPVGPPPGAWPGAQGGYAPPAPGAMPGGYAPPAPPQGFPQVAPPPGWGAPPNGAPQAPGMAPGAPGAYPGAPPLAPR